LELETGVSIHCEKLEFNSMTVNYRTGSKHNMAKLMESDIPVIRQLISDGMSCAKVASKFEVSRQTIYRIKTNQIWKHVK